MKITIIPESLQSCLRIGFPAISVLVIQETTICFLLLKVILYFLEWHNLFLWLLPFMFFCEAFKSFAEVQFIKWINDNIINHLLLLLLNCLHILYKPLARYMICKCFPSVCVLSFHSLIVSLRRGSKFGGVQFTFLIDYAFGVSESFLPNWRWQKFSPIFPSGSYTVTGFTFRSVTHFQLTYFYLFFINI